MCSRTLTATLFALGAIATQASHIIGGELYYDHLGGDEYRVTLKLYRDCSPGLTGYDGFVMLGVFTGDGAALPTINIPFNGSSVVAAVVDNPCLVPPENVCVEVAAFDTVLTLPPHPQGYVFSYQRCCRSNILSNVVAADEVGITCTVVIPPQGSEANSSPRFISEPPIALCLGEPASFAHQAFDADGDSLVYDLTTPFAGGTTFDPQPVPVAPPYALVTWQPPYSEAYPLASDPAMAIDPQTGELTVNPTAQGVFSVAVRVREYRNGVLLSEVRRDLCFAVVPCLPVTADIVMQQQAQFCTGLGIQFDNNGAESANWSWDFGVPGAVTDTSTAYQPLWEYPAPGTYTVTLISNPGLFCSDTAQAQFAMYHTPEPVLTLPAPMCGSASLELTAGGSFYPDADISWDLGPGAEPSSAGGPTVTAAFAATGVHPVQLDIVQHGCSASASGTLTVYPVPTAFFTVEPPPGSTVTMGDDLQFFDQSTSNGATVQQVQWSVDGEPVDWTGAAPIWEDVPPGQHAITLSITSGDGCTHEHTILYFIEPDAIMVPNVMTPNGDGRNDRFEIPFIEYIPNHLQILNRWGQEVYARHNYANQWGATGLPEGTYYYVLKLRDGELRTGAVTVLR